jgi:hypothetical protein
VNEEAEISMAVHRRCWIGCIDYRVFEKFMVNQCVVLLNSATVWLQEEWIQSTIIFSKSHQFLLLKYTQGGDMFRLYRAIIRPYLKNRSISFSSTFGIPSVYIDGVVITYVCYAVFYIEVKN